ncbi:MAG: DUF58 domain-containing protein [Chloroflexota bacterium]
MPTSRAASFLLAALALYFFANQTQIGWLYVMSALLAGTVLAARWLGRGALRHISADRNVGQASGLPAEELYEGDAVTVGLTLRNTGRASAALIRAAEHCPLMPSDALSLQLFIPSLPTKGSVRLDYEVIIDRRGLHEFPPLKLTTRAPFGFFQRKRTLPAPTRVLVYPELRRLRRLSLLDRQPAAQLTHPRAGLGTEIIGVRPFRSGDSPRHIHWRTVARTGQLASKEFADETQPGLTLALDLFRHPYPPEGYQPSGGLKKHTSFEYAVKIAASIGDYALRRNYPVHFATDSSAWPAPSGAVTRIALLEYLARVQPVGENKLADVLNNRAAQTFVAVLLPWPDSTVVESLVALRHRGLEVLAVLLDPESFPSGGPSARAFADKLSALGIESRLIKFGDDWTNELADPKSATNFTNSHELNLLAKHSW